MNIYIDGSFIQGEVRWAYVVVDEAGNPVRKAHGRCDKYTQHRNVTGELAAAMRAAEYLEGQPGTILYDFTGIEEWAKGKWRTKTEATQKYAAFMKKHPNVQFQKIRRNENLADKVIHDYMDSLPTAS